MRAILVALACVTACTDVKPGADGDLAGGPVQGYTLEVRASEAEQVFVVTAPDGERVGARAAGSASALMDASSLRAFLEASPEVDVEMREHVSLRMPGIDLSVRGDADAKPGEGGGAVSLNIGGQSIEINAEDGAVGERANVRISGVDEAHVRDFIAKADQLSPGVQAEMLAALGLD